MRKLAMLVAAGLAAACGPLQPEASDAAKLPRLETMRDLVAIAEAKGAYVPNTGARNRKYLA